MGGIFSYFYNLFQLPQKTYYLCIIGLAASGKTTLKNKLLYNEWIETIPTLSVDTDVLQRGNIDLVVMDTGGQDKLRVLWPTYLLKAEYVWYLIDASDRDNIHRAIEEMNRVLNTEENLGLCVCVILSKIDIPGAIRAEAFSSIFNIAILPQFQKKLFEISSKENIGIEDVLKWTLDRCKSSLVSTS